MAQRRSAGEKARQLTKRAGELEKLHGKFNDLTQGNLDQAEAWCLAYLDLLDLPRDLRLDLHTISFIITDSLTEQEMLEDLLLHGRTSSTHRKVHNFWRRLSQGEECRWGGDDFAYFEGGAMLEASPGTSEHPATVEAVAEYIAELPRSNSLDALLNPLSELIFDNRVNDSIWDEANRLNDLILKECEESLGHTATPPRESPLFWAVENMEFINITSLRRFLRCAKEYNLEWVMASFDWARGREPRMIPALQTFVDTSPWGCGASE